MNKTNTIGVDLAKNVFHQCTQDQNGRILNKTKLGRSQFKQFLGSTPTSRVVFESILEAVGITNGTDQCSCNHGAYPWHDHQPQANRMVMGQLLDLFIGQLDSIIELVEFLP